MHANENKREPLCVSITLEYIITDCSPPQVKNSLVKDIASRFNYDKNEVPLNDQTFKCIEKDLLQVLPRRLQLNRIGGSLLIGNKVLKHF